MSDIIEAAATIIDIEVENRPLANKLAEQIITAVAPLIRAAALEEAAQRIEADEGDYIMRVYAVAAIRTLKELP